MLRPDQAQRDREARMSQDQAKALAREAMRLRYIPIQKDRGAAYTNSGWAVTILEAIVTTAITPASGDVWGSGAVQLFYFDQKVSTTVAQPDLDGDDGKGNSPVLNWYTTSGTVAVGKHCQVYFAAGGLRLLTWEC